MTDLLATLPVLASVTPAAEVAAGPWWALLIPALPMLGVLLVTLCAIFRVKSKLPAWITVACLGAAFALTVLLWQGFDPAGGAQVVRAWDWFDIHWFDGDGHAHAFVAPFAFYIDTLTIYWMLFVTGLAMLIGLYASEYMAHDVGKGYSRFFVGFNLFVFSMACLVMGSNLVMLYLGWEGVGLCSYLLIGYFYKKPSAVAAAKKAFIVNRIGDLGLALGVYLTFVHFGTVDYGELFSGDKLQTYLTAASIGDFSVIPFEAQLIALLLMVGAFGKSAQLPLYVWLPDAMEGPTPVSALIHAATMVTAGVYLVARFYPVFLVSEFALPAVAWVGTLTALLAATIGMAQFDIKRIMAYSTVSQLGYMFAGLGMLTPTGGVFHVLTHAFFKALLFLACGAVMHGFAGQLDLRRLSGLRRVKGWGIVTFAMLCGCINLAGFPLTGGFFSKDTIIAEAFVTPGYAVLGWILIITAGLTAYYTFRVFFRVFMGPVEYHAGEEHHGEAGQAFHPHAPGWAVNLVLAVLAVGSLAATGLYFVGGDDHGKHFADSTVMHSTAAYHSPYSGHAFHAAHESVDAHGQDVGSESRPTQSHVGSESRPTQSHVGSESRPTQEHVAQLGPRGELAAPLTVFGYDPHQALYYISGGFGLAGILIAAGLHWVGRKDAAHCKMDAIARHFEPIPTWAENKWFVDELYDAVLRLPLRALGYLFASFDRWVIDGLVNGLGLLPGVIAGFLRPVQSGRLHNYAGGMVVGLAVVLILVVAFALRAGGAA